MEVAMVIAMVGMVLATLLIMLPNLERKG